MIRLPVAVVFTNRFLPRSLEYQAVISASRNGTFDSFLRVGRMYCPPPTNAALLSVLISAEGKPSS